MATMATEITARAERPAPDAPDDGDYETFCAALSASARGRAFLGEYARRNRNADTEQLLAAIAQLQQTVAPTAPQKSPIQSKRNCARCSMRSRQHKASWRRAIVAAKATKLADLVALVARRITAIMALAHVESPPPAEARSTKFHPTRPKDAVERTHLAVVPTPEQPELPIPSPLITPLPPIALVRSEAVMAEIAFVGPPPAPEVKPVTIKSTCRNMRTSSPAAAAPVAKPSKPAGPLASIMALSEEERLALFT